MISDKRIYWINVMLFIISFFLNADAFHVSFFNNGKSTIVKIMASPAGKAAWNVLLENKIGQDHTIKLNGFGQYGNWDFKVITENGEVFLSTMNPWTKQEFSFSEMFSAGMDIESDEDNNTGYTLRIKNLTGSTLVLLVIGPAGSGDLQQINLNNIGNNQSFTIKFNSPATTGDWDAAVISRDGSTYVKQKVDINLLLQFSAEDYVDVSPDEGDFYEPYDE